MKKITLLFLAILFITLLVTSVEAAKKRKRKSGSGASKRPSDTTPELYCNSCQAIVRETLKKIKSSRKEYDIFDALSNICSDKNYMVYEFPPPDMKKGCEAFMQGWQETLETEFQRRANNEDIEDEICINITKACEDVDPKNKQKMPQYVNVNGKQMPIGEDGNVKMETEDL